MLREPSSLWQRFPGVINRRFLGVVAVSTVLAVLAAGCSQGETSTSLSPEAAPTTTGVTTSSTTSTVATSAPVATLTPTGAALPLGELDGLAAKAESLLAGSPTFGELATELASLNRLADSTTEALAHYQDHDRAEIARRLAALEELRWKLAEWLTNTGLETPGLDLGPELDPIRLPALPSEGVAIARPGATVLVGLDGKILGHLRGYSIAYDLRMPGPLKLIDGLGNEFLLLPESRQLIEFEGREVLANGAEYVIGDVRSIDDIDTRQRTLIGPSWTYSVGNSQLNYSSGREIVTEQQWIESDGEFLPGPTRAINTVDGTTVATPDGCWIGATYGETYYYVCRPTDATDGPASLIYRATSDSEPSLLTRGPDADWEFPAGHWRSVLISPDGTELLGQWSGECEIPTAIRISTDDGTSAVVSEEPYEKAPASYALGWASTGEAVVLLEGDGVCAEPAQQPGIHLLSKPGTSTLLYDTGAHGVTARMWQPIKQRTCDPSDYVVDFAAEPATTQLAVWVNIHSQAETTCYFDLTGSLSVVDSDGRRLDVIGAPTPVRLTGLIPPGSEPFGEALLQQVWVWENWCGVDAILQVDLDDGLTAQLPGSPRCSDAGYPSELSPLGLDAAD